MRNLGLVTIQQGKYALSHIRHLEAESVHVLREVVAEFERPVLLYSIGKDSSVLLRLAQKAFYPGKIPFPLMHVDTGYKFQEMYAFRDLIARESGVELIVWRNEPAISKGANPFDLGTQKCCGLLKTEALLTGLRAHNFDAAIGGARRDEEKSRAKERFFSFRDEFGQWEPKTQRPEVWSLYNARVRPKESSRRSPSTRCTTPANGMSWSAQAKSFFSTGSSPPGDRTARRRARRLSACSVGSAALAACLAQAPCAPRPRR